MGDHLKLCVLALAVVLCDGIMAKPLEEEVDKYHHSIRTRRHVRSSQSKKTDWNVLAQDDLVRALDINPVIDQAKNVILFLGDGMGVSTVSAARIYQAQRLGLRVEDVQLAWEEFPNLALSKTHNVDAQTADSAGTATAYLCGEKANIATVGVNQNVARKDCSATAGNEVSSILAHSITEGKWTGVVTNTRITHATPSAAYAHSADRNWEHDIPDTVANSERCTDIAQQLVTGDKNKDIRVILGGGRARFLPDNVTDPEPSVFPGWMGRRRDGRNLIEEWKQIKRNDGIAENEFRVVKNLKEFQKVDTGKVQYLMGLFNPDHLDHEHQRMARNPVREPSLTQMTTKAIEILKRSEKGYFLLVEGGRIDHAHHSNLPFRALNDTVAMHEAVQEAVRLTDSRDTLIVVTADHSHAFTINGYPDINNPIFGTVDDENGEDGKPYLTLGYTNGPGFYSHRTQNRSLDNLSPRRNLTGVDTSDPSFESDAGVPMSYETHGGEDVGVYAQGPMAHLLQGVKHQHYIAHVMMYASCVGENKDHCLKPRRDPCATNSASGDFRACAQTLAVVVYVLSMVLMMVK